MTSTNIDWRRSSYSNASGGNCVECRAVKTRFQIRDSKHPHSTHLDLPTQEWAALLHAIRRDEV